MPLQAGGVLERLTAFVFSDAEGGRRSPAGGVGYGAVGQRVGNWLDDSLLAVGIGAGLIVLGVAFCLCAPRRTDYRYSRALQVGGSAEEVGFIMRIHNEDS